MIHLWYSNKLNRLVESLLLNIEQERSASGTALHTSHILVPNRNIEIYLTFEIARLKGIAANLRFHFLEDFLRNILAGSGKPVRILEQTQVRSLLISLFLEYDRKGGALPAEVTDYLSAGDGSGDEADLRRFQLAAQLARVFEEYSLSREEMLRAWRSGGSTVRDEAHAATERWQSRLWRLLYGEGGKLDRVRELTKKSYLCYGDAFDRVTPGSLDLPGSIHLFGFSYISRTLNRILYSLAARTEISFYSVTPCMEFWEDVLTKPEGWRLERKLLRRGHKVPLSSLTEAEDPFDLRGLTDTPSLRLWGRPGRENIHLLNSLTDSDFQPCFEEPPDARLSLLGRIQRDILCREPERRAPAPDCDFRGDRSITVLACPGIQREVEVIANEIWSLIIRDGTERRDPELRFNDIAVIIADAGEFDAYKTHIASVFREMHDIPHNVTDLALSGESRVVEAVQMLLSLPLSRYTREDILRLVTHPAVLARFPEADPREWVAWCEETGIVHGIDHSHHSDSYIGKDLYNWDQGLRRLALGAFMSGEQSGDFRAVPFGAEGTAYLPVHLPQSSTPNAALFVVVVRSLAADAEFARQARMSMSEWATFLAGLISCYVGAPAPEDERVLARCLAAVSSLREADLDGTPVGFRIARESVMSSLSGVSGTRGQYLASGVAVSSFLPMRPIPFKVVFIAGMGEGRFPAREIRNPLDLRSARRLAGDVSPRERDQYMFLETLISTRDRLCLSYVSRDGQTGERIEPSSVVKELLFMIERGYLGEEAAKALIVEHPLRRFDSSYFPQVGSEKPPPGENFSPAAMAESRAARLRTDLKAVLGQVRAAAMPEDAGHLITQKVRSLLGLSVIPDAPICTGDANLSVSVSALRRFLECPLQGWASHQLGLRPEETDEPVTRADEPFSTPPAEEAVLLRNVLLESLRTRAGGSCTPLTDTYDRIAAGIELRGTSPTGLFRAVERTLHLSILQGWSTQLGVAGFGRDQMLRVLRFGRAEEGATADEVYDPVTVELSAGNDGAAPLRAEIYGRTEALDPDLPGSVALLPKEAKNHTPKNFLRGFLDYLCLVATGRIAGKGFRVTAVFKDGFKDARFGPLSTEEAAAYLGRLVAELTGGPHAYLLPVEAVLKHRSGSTSPTSLGTAVTSLRDAPYGKYSSRFGPVPHPEDYEPPLEEEALAMVERRFGLFFRLLSTGSGGAE